ncbi:MAG: hypothetical protein V4538_13995 [Bacteroidota bacterium]
MYTKHFFLEEYRKIFTTWSEEKLIDYAEYMEKKYSTIKRGDNVVHLDYYAGLINETDILTIETSLAKINIELSSFDKNDVPYASLEQFMLQVSLFVGDKTTQDILFGIGTNAIWDTIKTVTFHVWKTVRNRSANMQIESKKEFNCGIKMALDKNTKFEFKIDGELSDEAALKSIDKILDFLKTVRPNQSIKKPDFIIFNQKKESWEIVDVNAELIKQILAEREKENNEVKDE